MEFKKFLIGGILSGIVILVVSMAISYAMQALFNYNVLALGGMRTVNDPIMTLFFVHPWVLGFAMAFLYPYVKQSLKGSAMGRGFDFGLITWVVAGLPSAFLVFSSMDYPLGFHISAVVGGILSMIFAGIVIAKVME